MGLTRLYEHKSIISRQPYDRRCSASFSDRKLSSLSRPNDQSSSYQSYIQADRSLDRSDDWTLAFHIIVLCAEVLTYCYGDDPKTVQIWDKLMARAQKWINSVPISFEPLFYRSPCQGQVFPTIMLLNDCHGKAKHDKDGK